MPTILDWSRGSINANEKQKAGLGLCWPGQPLVNRRSDLEGPPKPAGVLVEIKANRRLATQTDEFSPPFIHPLGC